MNASGDPAEQQPAADECFTNARENLNQAEELFNNTQGRNLDQVNAVVGIADAWTRLGRELVLLDPSPPVPTAEDIDPRGLAGWVRRRFNVHDAGGCSADDPRKCWVCALRVYSAAQTETPRSFDPFAPDEKPNHVHSIDCAHQWVRPTEPCAACAQRPTEYRLRCPVPCPEPGGWVSAP